MSRRHHPELSLLFCIEFISICFPNDILWSIKHLRSKLEYTQTGLRTYMIIFSPFHSPCSFIRLRLEITSFHSTQASGGARDVGFIVHRSQGTWFGQIFTGNRGLGLRQFKRLNSLLYVSQMIYYGHKSISGPKLIIYTRFQNIFWCFIG